MWTERRDSWGAVNFITGAGGFLQAVIYGYGGFRLQDSELTFNPTLPPNVTKMSIRLNYLGSCMNFVISERKITITVVFAGPIAPPLEVSTGGGVQNLECFKPVTLSRDRGAVRMSQCNRAISSKSCDHSPFRVCLQLLFSVGLYILFTLLCEK